MSFVRRPGRVSGRGGFGLDKLILRETGFAFANIDSLNRDSSLADFIDSRGQSTDSES